MPQNNEVIKLNVSLANTVCHIHRLLKEETASRDESSCKYIQKKQRWRVEKRRFFSLGFGVRIHN
jgi:hypothetical protein